MQKHNVFGLTNKQFHKKIYRIIPTRRLYPIFENKENTIVKTKLWEDPFENFMLRSKFRLATGEIATVAFREDFYGQCWSTRSQSEALWRLYSGTKESVRIRSTPAKLFSGLWKHLGEWAHISAFLGKVQYFSKRDLISHAKEMFSGIQLPKGRDFAETFLFKRNAFEHEAEIRLLYLEKDAATKDVFSYPVDPLDIVDDIRVDPRLNDNEANALIDEIKSRTGFPGTVKKSDLYDPPPDIIVPFGI